MDPALYHAHHSRHLEDLPFWDWLAMKYPGPILELGCGTGRSPAVAGQKWAVVGGIRQSLRNALLSPGATRSA